jgi:hypothetical protein
LWKAHSLRCAEESSPLGLILSNMNLVRSFKPMAWQSF